MLSDDTSVVTKKYMIRKNAEIMTTIHNDLNNQHSFNTQISADIKEQTK